MASLLCQFERFGEHYGVTAYPTRARSPKDKAHVENAVKLTYKDIFTVIEPLHCPDLRSLNIAIRGALEKHNNKDLIITGPTGTGKSYLATALGYKACWDGFRVMYASTAKLMSQFKIAKAKGTILTELKRIERVELLILDDFGMQPLDVQSRGILMDIIEDRHQRRSTMITSQVPVKNWHGILGEKTVADAILDRLVHHSLRVELFGESIRKRKTKSENTYE